MKSDPSTAEFRQALNRFPLIESKQIRQIDELGPAGGFSGASFWKIHTDGGDFCLRRWPPEHPPQKQLDWIHSELRRASADQLEFIPQPLACDSGDSFVKVAHRLWQVEPWVAGRPIDPGTMNDQQLVAAFESLARFHCAMEKSESGRFAVVPVIQERIRLLREFAARSAQQIAQASMPNDWSELTTLRDTIVARFARKNKEVGRMLDRYRSCTTRIIPCIRDMRVEHILFADSAVVGIIDFGAMKLDCPAADIARLLGDFKSISAGRVGTALAGYQRHRSLSAEDLGLIDALLASGQLMSPLMWLQWILIEGRRFENRQAVADRIFDLNEKADAHWPSVASMKIPSTLKSLQT